jgi:hypothetical protein
MAKYTNALALDIETLDTATTSVVIQIAAAAYTYTDKGAGKTLPALDLKLNTPSQIQRGRTISQDTMKFWFKNSDTKAVLGAILANQDVPVEIALRTLSDYIKRHDITEIWSQGPTFDITILEHLMAQFDIEVPWKFYQVRDLRTVQNFVGMDAKAKAIKDGGVTHNALDDVHTQIALHRHYIKKAAK